MGVAERLRRLDDRVLGEVKPSGYDAPRPSWHVLVWALGPLLFSAGLNLGGRIGGYTGVVVLACCWVVAFTGYYYVWEWNQAHALRPQPVRRYLLAVVAAILLILAIVTFLR